MSDVLVSIGIPLVAALLTGIFTGLFSSGGTATPAGVGVLRRAGAIALMRDMNPAVNGALSRLELEWTRSGWIRFLMPKGGLHRPSGATGLLPARLKLVCCVYWGVGLIPLAGFLERPILIWQPTVLLAYLAVFSVIYQATVAFLLNRGIRSIEPLSEDVDTSRLPAAQSYSLIPWIVSSWFVLVAATVSANLLNIWQGLDSHGWPLFSLDFALITYFAFLLGQAGTYSRIRLQARAFHKWIPEGSYPAVRVVVHQGWGRVSTEIEGTVRGIDDALRLERSDGYREVIRWGSIVRIAVQH